VILRIFSDTPCVRIRGSAHRLHQTPLVTFQLGGDMFKLGASAVQPGITNAGMGLSSVR
jgi:hypothetical protein